MVGGEVDRTWKELGKENHDLNALCEKKSFSTKKEGEKQVSPTSLVTNR